MIKDKNDYMADIAEVDVELRDKIVSHIQKAIIRKAFDGCVCVCIYRNKVEDDEGRGKKQKILPSNKLK
jgi:hypothetical protein